MQINLHADLEGYFNLVVRDAKTLKIKRQTGLFKNLITNYGLNRLATDGVLKGACVGSGTSAPLATDTALQSEIARTKTRFSDSTVFSAGSPYYCAKVITYRFAEGAAAGNISEVGINANESSPFELWSRSRVLDTSGNPTTITVLPNEVLDVVYECRIYAMESDVSGGPITLLGQPYFWTLRAISVTSDYAGILGSSGFGGPTAGGAAFDGDMVPVTTSNPSGTDAGDSGSGVMSAYVNNSLKRRISHTWAISQGNSGGGIKTMAFYVVSSGPRFQLGFDKIFPKGPTNTLSVVLEYSWSRRVI